MVSSVLDVLKVAAVTAIEGHPVLTRNAPVGYLRCVGIPR